MNKTIFLCIVLAFIVSCSQQENRLLTFKPEKVGLSSDRLNRIKPVMQRYIDENKLPGMITMVARHGKVVNFEKYGLMDVDMIIHIPQTLHPKSMISSKFAGTGLKSIPACMT